MKLISSCLVFFSFLLPSFGHAQMYGSSYNTVGGGGHIPAPVTHIPQMPNPDAMQQQMDAAAEGHARMNYGAAVTIEAKTTMTTYDVTMRQNIKLLADHPRPSEQDWRSLNQSTDEMRAYLQKSIDIFDRVWGFFPLDKPNKSNRNSPFHLSGLKARADLNEAIAKYDELIEYARDSYEGAFNRERRLFYSEGSHRFKYEMNQSLQRQAISGHRDWKEATDRIDAVGDAQVKEAQVSEAITLANRTLPTVINRMEPAAANYVRDQIKSSQTLAADAVDYARCETDNSAVRMFSDYALDTINSVNVLLINVAGGFYNGFVTTAQATQAIYNDPNLVRNLAGNMLLVLEGERGRQIVGAEMMRGAQEAMRNFREALYQYGNTAVHGTLEERGQAIGRLGHQISMLLVGPEIAGALVEAGAGGMLGTALYDGINASETLAPEMGVMEERIVVENTTNIPLAHSADARMLIRAREAVMRNLEVCTQVRNGYRAEVNGIREVARNMLEQGNSEEMVARHVHGMRREIGQRYKDMTPLEVREHIYGRNLENGVDPLGPTIEELRTGRPAMNGNPAIAPKSWADIIESSSRTNPRFDRFFETTIGD